MRISALTTLICMGTVIHAQTYSSSSVLSCGNNITAREVLEQRIPSLDYNTDIPKKCHDAVSQKKAEWRASDALEIDRIVNEYCSHKAGWTEFTPGTCDAGGPPPICVASHWYKDPVMAEKQWRAKLDRVLSQRQKEAKDLMCGCWQEHLEEGFAVKNNSILPALSSKADLSQSSQQAMSLPCLNISGSSPCPPNYRCVNGYCVPQTAAHKSMAVLRAAGAKGLEDATMKQLENVLSESGSVFKKTYAILNNPYVTAISIAGGPRSISTTVSAYQNASNRLKEDMSKCHSLLLELNRYEHRFQPNSGPSRDRQYIVADLQKTRKSMSDNYTLMSEFYRGVLIEDELFNCNDCCPGVFQAYNEQLGVYYSIFNSINVE